MAKRPPRDNVILTTAANLPRRCPALWDAVPTRTSESGGVTRLTCPVCGWTERYRVTDAV